jgi:hypothetical protein
MVNKSWNQGFEQPLDASYGLIFRLNHVWESVDIAARGGDFEKWNTNLDRVFCNLLYKEPLDVEYDEEGNLINVCLSKKDQDLYDFLNKEYEESKKEFKMARTRSAMVVAKEKVYKALIMKDVGLRKFMYQLKLYLRQSEKNPAHAMWGG